MVMLNSLINKLSETIYWMDTHGRIIHCNDRQAQLFGLAGAQELIGKDIFDVANLLGWPVEIPNKIQQNNLHVMQIQQTVMTEEEVLLDGVPHVFLVHKHPWLENAELRGVIGIGIDITQKKLAESLALENVKVEQSAQAMRLLAGTMAHELRTPLAGIQAGAMGLAKLLPRLVEGFTLAQQHGLLTANAQDKVIATHLTSVADSLTRQTRYAHLFIDMMVMNLKAGEIIDKDFCSLSMASCIESALAHYPFHPDDAKLIHWQAGEGDFEFHGDELLTRHVLFNLLKNALYYIKAAGKGELTITVKPATRQLVFMDTGVGIAAEMLPNIFKRFYSSSQDSAGVGLAFCKMVMDAYRGDIRCESVYGEYSKFILSFPALS